MDCVILLIGWLVTSGSNQTSKGPVWLISWKARFPLPNPAVFLAINNKLLELPGDSRMD